VIIATHDITLMDQYEARGWCCIMDGCISMNRPGEERGLLVDLGHERPRVSANARNLSPIVPRGSIAGRALVAVVAIMTFLASMTTGAVAVGERVGGGVAVRGRERNHHSGAPRGRARY